MFLPRLFWKTNVFGWQWICKKNPEPKFSSDLSLIWRHKPRSENTKKSGKFRNFFFRIRLVFSSSMTVIQIAGPSIVWKTVSCLFNYPYIVLVFFSCTLHSKPSNSKTNFIWLCDNHELTEKGLILHIYAQVSHMLEHERAHCKKKTTIISKKACLMSTYIRKCIIHLCTEDIMAYSTKNRKKLSFFLSLVSFFILADSS